MITLSLLGSPLAALDDQLVTGFISNKVLGLLCYLVLNRERIHTRDALATLLWGEMPDERAKSNLRHALHNIQKLFPGYLSVTRQTVAFDKSQSCWLDVATFAEQVARPETDVAQLEAAIALYRGDFLEGVFTTDAPLFEEWLIRERERYRLLLLSALERLSACYAQMGEWGRAAELTRRVLNIEPWREIAYRQLMLLLARQGEYNAALAQYEACSQILDCELSITPAAETVALYERIRKIRLAPRHHNLPVMAGELIGRHVELQVLDEWVRDPDCRLITLLGLGGVGKTRLAQELAAHHLYDFLDGICYVPLGAIARPEFLVTTIAEAIDAKISGNDACRELFEYLADQELLLVLDGFEHLISAANWVAELLQAVPNIKVIVTSREKLDVRGEWVFALQGLPVPPEGEDPDKPLESYGAIEYFVLSARRQRHDFALNKHRNAVKRLSRLLGGLPLGIELAATLLSVLTCEQLVSEVTQSLDMLATTRQDVPSRHRSLRAVFESSWGLLTDTEQALFPRLSVFRGSFTLDAARQVAGAGLQDLNGLSAKSLLLVGTGDGTVARYAIHEVLRQYAEEILAGDPSAQQEVQAAYITHYADVMRQQDANWVRENRRAFFAVMTGELENIRLAWERAVASQDTAALGCMLRPMYWFYRARGWFQDGSALFALAMDGLQDAVRTDRETVCGRLLACRAEFEMYLGRVDTALALAERSVQLLRQHGANEYLAFVLNILGCIQHNDGSYSSARETFLESLAIWRALNNRYEMLSPMVNLAGACTLMGDYAIAERAIGEGLGICYEDGHQQSLAFLLSRSGDLAFALGNWRDALRYYEQALQVSQSLEQIGLNTMILNNWGRTHLQLGEFEQASTRIQAALELARQHDYFPAQVEALAWLGWAQRGLGSKRAAHACLQEGLQIALKRQFVTPVLTLLTLAARLLLDEGRQTAGVDLLAWMSRHPAIARREGNYVAAMLAEQGISSPQLETCWDDRSLAEIINSLLAEPVLHP